uniref:Uncharacterized protein n=1 Tax=Arundo donax TaxID=35708 RepID=A0A0A9ES59_ARUDO
MLFLQTYRNNLNKVSSTQCKVSKIAFPLFVTCILSDLAIKHCWYSPFVDKHFFVTPLLSSSSFVYFISSHSTCLPEIVFSNFRFYFSTFVFWKTSITTYFTIRYWLLLT